MTDHGIEEAITERACRMVPTEVEEECRESINFAAWQFNQQQEALHAFFRRVAEEIILVNRQDRVHQQLTEECTEMSEYTVYYVGKPLGNGLSALIDWYGNQVGTCRSTASWRVNSWIGSHMHQFKATIDGVKYTGRGFGEGMCIKLRRVAEKRG